MKGDFTRATFDPAKHYSSVRLQQGRVVLDADWNEQADLVSHRHRTTARDLIGGCGGPLHAAAFGVVQDPTTLDAATQQALTDAGVLPLDPFDVVLTAGRYYVHGILCEAEQPFSYLHQPDVIEPQPLVAGRHLLYLHVWERHLTWLDDPRLREVALGGPDTATRARVVWQVGSIPVAAGSHCMSPLADWDTLTAPSTGTLRARAQPGEDDDQPCAVSAGAGYQRLENQLYRVEIHTPGQLNQATFKWSRDNGSVVTSVQAFDGQDLTVGDTGRDALLSFATGQYVELVDDSLDLAGEPGQLYEIDSVDPAAGVVRLVSAPAPVDLELHPRLRRWESAGALTVRVPAGNDGYLALEGGVEIRFGAGSFRTGDYWQIPARTAVADVEWPLDDADQPVPLTPSGIHHHYCRLAIVDVAAGGAVTLVSDCRSLFPPVTELTDLNYVGGDGQEVMPDLTQPAARVALPLPLRVGVANGRWPVQNARVRFTVSDGDGRVAAGGPEAASVEVLTGTDGLAQCTWSLLPTGSPHRVTAELLDAASNPVGLPVIFGANLSVATQVAYDPRTVCGNAASPGSLTVQAAIDRLTRLTRLYYAGGDGQEALPGAALPRPLRVVVSSDCGPAVGATVRFQCENGGRLAATTAGLGAGTTQADIATSAEGVAECFWQPANDPARLTQLATATLRAVAAGSQLIIHPPATVRYTARLSLASQVAYAPPDACTTLQDAETVQEALDQLCAALSAPTEGVRITTLQMGTTALENDRTYPFEILRDSGIDVSFDLPVDGLAGRRPVCSVVVEMPSPNSWQLDMAETPADPSGYLPLVLAANTNAAENVLQWRATQRAGQFLELFLNRFPDVQLLVRLYVRGNFVRGREDGDGRWLDGDTVERMAATGATGLMLPSGDGVRGGTFEMWFWLHRPRQINVAFTPSSTVTRAQPGVTLATGIVTLSSPAPAGGVRVPLASSNTDAVTVPEFVVIPEGETQAPFEAVMAEGVESTSVGSVTISAGFGETPTRRRLQLPGR